MEEHATTPQEVVRAVIAALNRGDIDAALAYCADDIKLWVPGPELEGQVVWGKAALRRALEASEARWPDTWTAVRTLLADGDRVAVEMTVIATEEGVRLRQPMAAFFLVRDGLITEQASYYDLGALERALDLDEDG